MSVQKQYLKAKQAWKVTFSVPKAAFESAKEIKVLGDFINWEAEKAIPMKAKNGDFLASVELEPGKAYQFRYLIDNEIWENDPEADDYAPTPFGVENSVVVTDVLDVKV